MYEHGTSNIITPTIYHARECFKLTSNWLWTVLYQCASCTERVSTTTLVHKIKRGNATKLGEGGGG